MGQPTSREPIPVTKISEEYNWLRAHPCECRGRWSVIQQGSGKLAGAPEHTILDRLEVSCGSCSRKETFLFLLDKRPAQERTTEESLLKDIFGEHAQEFLKGKGDPPKKG
jgi:hypothetical protein